MAIDTRSGNAGGTCSTRRRINNPCPPCRSSTGPVTTSRDDAIARRTSSARVVRGSFSRSSICPGSCLIWPGERVATIDAQHLRRAADAASPRITIADKPVPGRPAVMPGEAGQRQRTGGWRQRVL